MKRVIVVGNRAVSVFESALPESTLAAVLRSHNVQYDEILSFPSSSPIAPGDDVRRYTKSGCLITDVEIESLLGTERNDPRQTFVPTETGWELVTLTPDTYYVIDGNEIREVQGKTPPETEWFSSYRDIFYRSLHGAKIIARKVLETHVNKEMEQPVVYENHKIYPTSEVVQRLFRIVIIGEEDTPWTFETAHGSLSLSTSLARELLKLILARNETLYQFFVTVYRSEILPATSATEIENIFKRYMIFEELEEYCGKHD